MKLYESYADFLQDLETGGFEGQVYDGRTTRTGVKTPYIVCINEYSRDYWADNARHVQSDDLTVMLLSFQDAKGKTSQRDKAKEKLEAFFTDRGVPFSSSETYLDEAELWQDRYDVRIFYGE